MHTLMHSGVPIAGIGASSGGVEALRAFFAALPERTGVAFVVIIHLSPEHESQLSQILARECSLPIREVHGEMALTADHVYVIGPDQELRITDTHVSATPFDEPHGQRAPIDTFFRSLAVEHGDGFAVVLSGSNADGAGGVRAVKEGGGLVLVQDPAEAAFDVMPRATIATGMADLVLPVRELAIRLGELAATKRRVREHFNQATPERLLNERDEECLRGLLAHLRMRSGHDFGRYKRATVLRRVARRMHVTRHETLIDYAEYVRGNAEEAQALFDDLLIKVTTFFRDSEAWQALAEQVIPTLFESLPTDQPVRAWVPGCATGEEAYTLTMLLIEEAERQERWPEVQIFASDLDEGALATARVGHYPASIADDIDKARLARFFIEEDGGYRIGKALRDRVLFATHSMLGDPPFMRLDLISCRNLLIYLEREAQRHAFSLFHYALVPRGCLFLGSAESADPERFEVIDKRQQLFRARVSDADGVVPKLDFNGRYSSSGFTPPPLSATAAAHVKLQTAEIESLAPPSVLIDAGAEIVRLHEGAGRYMEPADGTPTRELIAMLRPELRSALRVALHEAREHGKATMSEPIAVRFDDCFRRVALWVRPRGARPAATRTLVVFLEGSEFETATSAADTTAIPLDPDDERQMREALRLSEGLRLEEVRHHERTIEALRASNEELQSVNEEYRSTTEELETSKEELHSINEELNTANIELKGRFDEVSRARDDIENLMKATDIATLFLDQQLTIQRFTPTLLDLYNIKSFDLGRPIQDITHRLDYHELQADARAVLADHTPLAREAVHEDGRSYVVQLRAYCTLEGHIDGVVVTFVDISEHEQDRLALASSESRLYAVMASLPSVVPFATDADGRLSYISPSVENYAGISPAELLGEMIYSCLVHADDRGYSEASWIEALERGSPYEVRHRLRVGDDAYRWAITRAQTVPGGDRGSAEWFGAITDVDEVTRIETQLRDHDRHRNRFLALLGHELRNPLAAIGNCLQVLASLDETQRDTIQSAGVPIGQTMETLERQNQHMTRLIDDLLDLTRISNGKVVLRKRPVLLDDCVRQTLETLRPRLQHNRIEFSARLPDSPVHLVADPVRLNQMLGNLLDNAIKFSDPDGRIELTATAENDTVTLTVRDAGIGIAREALPSLFRPFTQIVDSNGAERGGLGLGLALIRDLAELHGGSVSAHSEGLGKGSVFALRLPLGQPGDTPAERVDEPRSDARELPHKRILVVDDSPDVADPFAALLRTIKQEVCTAYDGGSALQAVEHFEPEVAFLDLGMPGIDGFELARRLRQHFPAEKLTLIALTGYGQTQDIHATRAAGFDHHLLKPVRFHQVRELLRSLDSPAAAPDGHAGRDSDADADADEREHDGAVEPTDSSG